MKSNTTCLTGSNQGGSIRRREHKTGRYGQWMNPVSRTQRSMNR